MPELFYIWSYEHNAWWKPDSMGYTMDLRKAGRYKRDEASEILENANRSLNRGNENEAMVPVDAFMHGTHKRIDPHAGHPFS